MKKRLENYAAVKAAIEAGDFCDCGHYYCVRRLKDGSFLFPSGGLLTTDGTIRGPRNLLLQLEAIPADYRPKPIAPCDRYPSSSSSGDKAKRICAIVE